MTRILVADDHAMVRRGLKETLEEELGHVTFGEAQDSQQVLERLMQSNWDLLILDINMKGRSGLDLLGEVRQAWPQLPVLVLSMYPVAEFGVRAVRLGAAGYLNKQSAPEELTAAVRRVLSGGRFISADLGEHLAGALQGPEDQPLHTALSNREFQVLQLLAAGKNQREIADELCINAKTVGTYHTRLLDKMRMKTDAELIRYAIQHQLVE
ncbi:MAG TPA: response regulator transcription factor [Candidatus Xenobia bacterium]